MNIRFRTGLAACVVLLAAAHGTRHAAGQTSSLYGDPSTRRGLSIADASWMYEPKPEPGKQFKIHDQLTVMVSEKSMVTSNGQINLEKKLDFTAVLKNWILLNNFSVVPDPQTSGDPQVTASYDNKNRSQADLQTKDTMSFKIAVAIVDRRPNGNLVLEGRRSIQNNDSVWEQCLTGVIRPEDVLPNNTVLSESVAELRIFKREQGQVRDGYRRGWLYKALDKYQPF